MSFEEIASLLAISVKSARRTLRIGLLALRNNVTEPQLSYVRSRKSRNTYKSEKSSPLPSGMGDLDLDYSGLESRCKAQKLSTRSSSNLISYDTMFDHKYDIEDLQEL